jgi:hypothetical protein
MCVLANVRSSFFQGLKVGNNLPALSLGEMRERRHAAPGDASWTSAWFSGGAFLMPAPSGPWQAAHSRAKSLAPARCARCCPSKGLLSALTFGGACWTSVPTRAQAAAATSRTRTPVTGTRSPLTAHRRYFETDGAQPVRTGRFHRTPRSAGGVAHLSQ